jgi:hypothetical protein
MRLSVHHDKRTVRGSTVLALAVYWNTLYSLFIFVIVAWVVYANKLVDETMTPLSRAWYAAIIALWMFCEVPRLLLGRRGNETQSVAHIFGFLILTIMSHMGMMLVYNVAVPWRNSLDYAVSIVQLMFGFVEIVVGVHTLRHLVRRNTVDFYVHVGSGEEQDDGPLIAK